MTRDVIVVGGGLIGLSVAWRSSVAGLRVAVIDDAPGSGASHVAAGMLAPVTEVAYGEEPLLKLGIASAQRWPSFAAELEAAAGTSVGYRADGTLLVGADGDDVRALEELQGFQLELGLDVERLTARRCREREPLLSPRVRGGLLAADDHQVDPRATMAALLRACDEAGVERIADRVAAIEHDGRRVHGVRLVSGRTVTAPQTVVCAGWWSGSIEGLPDGVAPPVRPVKGQLVVLRGVEPDGVVTATVRGLVHGRSVYLVPRADGRLVVGATQEERGPETTVTAGGVRQLLDDAATIVPGIDELELVETLAGLRPGTPDNRPIIGRASMEGLLFAAGHHRHGVLLAPVTADAIAALLAGGEPDRTVAVARPERDSIRRAAPGTMTSGADRGAQT